MNTGVLLHHMEEFSGIAIAITNRYALVDTAFHRRFKFILEFTTPDAPMRAKLWRMHVPAEAPMAPDVNFEELGQRFELSGGHIKSAVFRAAVEASGLKRQALHAAVLGFVHPVTGQPLRFETAPPEDMQRLEALLSEL
jgi:AAA+ superfamily predicted ATPase